MPRLLPDRAAAALARAHHALPAPVHAAAFDDGSDLLTLAGTRDAATPGALEASHELYRETLRVTRGVRLCAMLVLWRGANAHEWLTAFCAVFVLDCVDVYRAVFAVASQRALAKREERLARDVVGLARLAALAGAVRAEATAMIDSFDPIAMALEEGSAGTYTIRQHLCGCALSAAWLALVAAAAAPRLGRVARDGKWVLFGSRFFSAGGAAAHSDARDDGRETRAETRHEAVRETDDDGWCGPDRAYWSLFTLDPKDGDGERERARFLETLGVAFAFLSRRFGPFLASPSPGTSPAGTLARVLARALAVVGLLGAVDANARIDRG